MRSVLASGCPDLHAYFLGAWCFERTMQAADGTLIGTAEGLANFEAQAKTAELHYHETGKLHLTADARVISFSKRFAYRLDQRELLHVVFADGPQAGQSYQYYQYDRQRHALLPVQTHICVADHYDACYQFLDAEHFDLRTRINGPNKDVILLTHFMRSAT